MMVVISLFAILVTLGFGALISVRDMNIPDSASQDFLGNVRDAQNRAFLVMKDTASPTPHDTKVWVLKVVPKSTTYELYSYYPATPASITLVNPPYGEKVVAKATAYNTGGAVIDIDKNTAGVITHLAATDTVYIAFAAPFAKSYLIKNTACLSVLPACSWGQSSRPSQDWQPSDTTVYSSANNDGGTFYQFYFTYNSQKRSVTVRANGDANVN